MNELGGSFRDPNQPDPNEDGAWVQGVRVSPVTARVPEKVSRGAFSTGVLVLQGPHEFILDFVLRMNQPHVLSARVVLPVAVMPLLINALQENLANFEARYGPVPKLPPPPPNSRVPSVEEIYEKLKLPDEMLSGAYANAVMISHSPAEFCFDFIAQTYPRSAVSARVFLAAAHIPRMIDSLKRSYDQHQKKTAPPPPPPAE
jgi:hypothetical protein